MTTRIHDPGLFQPTVGVEDDATEFRKPWNPHSILFVVFFGGLISGGVLFSLNARRLGLHRQARGVLLVCVASALVIYGGLTWLMANGTIEALEDRRLSRNVVRFISLAVGLGVSAAQSRRYRLAVRTDAGTASLLMPGILAVVAGMLVDTGVIFLFRQLFKLLGVGAI